MQSYIRKYEVYPDEFPESWASGWGEDEYGLWMAFTYKGASQKFRWCEPGTFLMGSPEGEVGRESIGADESQHEVILTTGFWIADTTVTQALWEVVMQNNPSRFKGANRPVENVRWDDAQEFIQKMNMMKPALKLQLPFEAQWEYACRAGSTTPFCWGDEIRSELVNYDAGEVFADDQETVDVESFFQNDWGLWQMHGNVDEWCQDWFRDYSLGVVIDPQGAEVGHSRTLRGGSSFRFAADCRSAYRNFYQPAGYNNEYIGFRLARGS